MALRQLFWMMVLGACSAAAQAAALMNLDVGQASAIKTKQTIGSVFIASPEVADYQIIDKHKLVIFGRGIGRTSLILFDEDGETLLSRTLLVNESMIDLQQMLKINYPDFDISVQNFADRIVLTGMVPNDKIKDEIGQFIGELLAKNVTESTLEFSSESAGVEPRLDYMTQYRYEGIINNLEVAVTKQVNVKLTVAEVSHSFLEQVGFGGVGGNSGGSYSVDMLDKIKDALSGASLRNILNDMSFNRGKAIGQILAEPNLSVISGETASFLVGGELPMVTTVDGGANVQYKEYGIRLQLAAKVDRDDKIRITLSPEVSTLDYQYSSGLYNLPGLLTRRTTTTVELGDGQSFVLSGLLNSQERESLSQIPFISSVPVLGALFTNTDTQREKTELIVIAHVNLVQPLAPSDVVLPAMQSTTTWARFFALDSINTNQNTQTSRWLEQGGFIE